LKAVNTERLEVGVSAVIPKAVHFFSLENHSARQSPSKAYSYSKQLQSEERVSMRAIHAFAEASDP